MDDYSSSLMLKELHSDLARKYKTHGAKVETAWRSFNRLQRAKCMKAGMAEGAVLKTSTDTSLGNVYKFIPEWNLADIAEPNSNLLIDILKYRATKSLPEQYSEGVNGSPGDFALIDEMTKKKNLRHVNSFTNCYTFFYEEKYGESIQVSSEHLDEVLASLRMAIDRGILIPQALGELILQRQITLLQCLNVIIGDILEEGSQTRNKGQSNKQSKKAPTAPLSKSATTPAVKLSPREIIASAQDQMSSLEEYLSLLRSEPTVLCPGVNIQFFGRPELVPDEKGRSLPVYTDKYVSSAVYETIHHAVQGIAVWESITGLIELLEKSAIDKLYKTMVLQELSNMCHFEFARVQALFKRQVATAMGSKWFKRLSNVYDNAGNAKVSLKGKPDELTRSDPQLHYLLRLCQPETTLNKAVEWMQKLSDLYKSHPLEREKLAEREARTLYDVAAIVALFQDLSSAFSLPSASRKKGSLFVTNLQGVDVELSQFKKDVDLRDFAAPIDNLLEPGVAAKALDVLDQFVTEKTGTKMGSLYQDELEKTFQCLAEQYRQAKDKMDKDGKAPAFVPIDTTPQDPSEKIENRKQKEKTRPAHSSIYSITPAGDSLPEKETVPPAESVTVSSTTAEVFATLFDRTQSRGSVGWTAFEAAMTELGFLVFPRFGSVYTFRPSETMTIKRPCASGLPGRHDYVTKQGYDPVLTEQQIFNHTRELREAGYNVRAVWRGPEIPGSELSEHMKDVHWHAAGIGFGVRGSNIPDVISLFEETIDIYREQAPDAKFVFNYNPLTFLWSVKRYFPLSSDCKDQPGKDLPAAAHKFSADSSHRHPHANMVQRKFQLIEKYDFDRTYHGIPLAKRWQLWETAHFLRVKPIIDSPEIPARLISYGCNNGDSNLLNCTATCSNTTLMYDSSANVWNCITLATLAMLVGPGNDTIDRDSEREMDEKFHFGTVEKFNGLGVFQKVRSCAWASCSDSTYGRCTDSLWPFKCNAVSQYNIQDFGNVMAGPYCRAARAGIDLDIAGQGIVTAYIIQLVLVLSLGLCFKLTRSWVYTFGRIVGTIQKSSSFRETCRGWQVSFAQTRFANATSSALLDFQESQALFATTVSITAIITFGGSKAGLANMLTLLSWMFNNRIMQGLVTTGMYPVLMAQLAMHRAGERRLYTLFFVVLSWILMIIITEFQDFNDAAFENHLKQVSTVQACGNNPGPMSFCQGIKDRASYEFFALTLTTRFAVHIIVSCLIIDWALHFANTRVAAGGTKYTQIGGGTRSLFAFADVGGVKLSLSIFWAAVELLTTSLIIIGLRELVDLLDMHSEDGGLSAWGYGQLVAVAIWFPVMIKFVSLNIVGPKQEIKEGNQQVFEMGSHAHKAGSSNNIQA
ncbi:hypothetical protein FGRMN_1264 [Fusarium graminum]|nr:hypothetical protein FGRMN_1264 [Fusarium graminum]